MQSSIPVVQMGISTQARVRPSDKPVVNSANGSSSASLRIATAIRSALGNYLKADDSASPDTDHSALARRALAVLGQCPEFEDREGLALALMVDRRYYQYLIETDVLSVDDCIRAAEILSKVDTSFVAGLVRCADEVTGVDGVMRTLEIVDRLKLATVAAQWVGRMTTHRNANIRSRSVKVLAMLHANISMIEKQLASTDARVRANALEGLWGESSPRHRQLLERATADPHHRVAINGLYGLYLANAPGILERMIQVAAAPSPQHRAAIAWAMGKTGSPDFAPELEKLAADPEECVRSAATRALAALQETAPLVTA